MCGARKIAGYALAILVCVTVLLFYFGFYRIILADGNELISSALDSHLTDLRVQENKGRIVDRDGLAWPTRISSAKEMLIQLESEENASIALDSVYHLFYSDDHGLARSNAIQFFGRADGSFDAIDGVRDLYEKKGYDLYSTISGNLNQQLYKALKNSGADHAAAIITNYQTGEVLAYTSIPSVSVGDPNISKYDESYNEKSAWMLDQVTNEIFQPGSIQKIATALGAIRHHSRINIERMEEAIYECTGSLAFSENKIVTCPYPHGEVTLTQGFARSCNCMFAWLASELGGDLMTQTSEDLGYNKTFEFMGRRLIYPVSKYILPVDRTEFGMAWSGAGQDADGVDVKAMPYHIMVMLSAIANGGQAYEPYVVLGLADRMTGEFISSAKPKLIKEGLINLSSNEARDLQALMESVCSENGTGAHLGGRMKALGYSVAGKTGTAEIGKIIETLEQNGEVGLSSLKGNISWIACYVKEVPVAMVITAVRPKDIAAADIAIDILPEAIELMR
ncbi:MAG: hypothetical protein LBQ68_02795 [Clostridiales bacterium]|jgi:peptidoglycan glycosyltransferase|nr:hypothetical protein [Clostridiales bacterium]